MTEYIVAENLDDRVLQRCVSLLRAGQLIAFPTEVSWTIACSLQSPAGIKRLRALSGTRDQRHFTLLCENIAMASEYCSLDNTRFRLLRKLSPGPYVFILKPLLGTEKTLECKRKELGIRISSHPVPMALSAALDGPLYSITAKRSMADSSILDLLPEMNAEEAENTLIIPEEELFDGGWELESIEGLEVILDTGEERERLLSTVLELLEDEVQLLRAGAGQWPI